MLPGSGSGSEEKASLIDSRAGIHFEPNEI